MPIKASDPTSKSTLDLEVKILRLIQNGVPIKEIAQRIDLTTDEVSTILGDLADKLLTAKMAQESNQVAVTRSSVLSKSDEPKPEPEPEKLPAKRHTKNSIPAILSAEKTFAGRYELHSIIGQGGTGVVYKAKHVFMERLVAIKVLSSESASDLKLISQFKKESQAISALKHQNIITVYDFGVTEHGQPFLVMDYIDGPSLEQVFEGKQAVDYQRYVDIFLQICEGLAITHAHGFIHCDLKPSNILMDKTKAGTDLVKIVDFGLAKALPNNLSSACRLTDSFEVAGSPLYMSPEQCTSNILDARSDIYSLACIMYEAFTRRPIFDGTSSIKVLSQHLSDAPKRFKEVQPNIAIPAKIEAIVLKALAKNPNDRYQSVLELRQDLIRCRGALTKRIEIKPPPTKPEVEVRRLSQRKLKV